MEKFITVKCALCGEDRKLFSHQWIRAYRIASGIKQNQLAKMLNMSKSYLSEIEHGRRNCPEKLAEFYKKLIESHKIIPQ